jgi:hypothetical protein
MPRMVILNTVEQEAFLSLQKSRSRASLSSLGSIKPLADARGCLFLVPLQRLGETKSLLDGVYAQINSLPLSRDGLCERRLPNSRQSPKDDQHCLVIEYNLYVQRLKRAARLPVADVTSFAIS